MSLRKAHFAPRFKFLFPEAFLTVRSVSASPVDGVAQIVPGPAGSPSAQANENAGKQRLEVNFNVYATRESALEGGEAIENITKTYYVDVVQNPYAQAEALAAKELDAELV